MSQLKPIRKDTIPEAFEKASATGYSTSRSRPRAFASTSSGAGAEPRAGARLPFAVVDRPAQPRRRSSHGAGARAFVAYSSDYEKAYYGGIIRERLPSESCATPPGAKALAYGYLHERWPPTRRPKKLAPSGNDDAVLAFQRVRAHDRASRPDGAVAEEREPLLE
jgi:hypothetical protein